jgi:hypothetical protein
MGQTKSSSAAIKIDTGFHSTMEKFYRITSPAFIVVCIISQVVFPEVWFLGLLGFATYLVLQMLANQHRIIHLMEASLRKSGMETACLSSSSSDSAEPDQS